MGFDPYMAAGEHFQRCRIDNRTDLYSLGCIFSRVGHGHPAFDGENVSGADDGGGGAHLKKVPNPMKEIAARYIPSPGKRLEFFAAGSREGTPIQASGEEAAEALRTDAHPPRQWRQRPDTARRAASSKTTETFAAPAADRFTRPTVTVLGANRAAGVVGPLE